MTGEVQYVLATHSGSLSPPCMPLGSAESLPGSSLIPSSCSLPALSRQHSNCSFSLLGQGLGLGLAE